MRIRADFRHAAAIILLCTIAASVGAQPQSHFKNLKVLPQDIPPAQLVGMMNGFCRALGVRCIHCHVGEEGRPFRPGEFAMDDKPTKLKARAMIQMMRDINEKYLATLENRANPPVGVQCITCHRGVPQPRMLQDVLKARYDAGGVDSTIAEYQRLRDRYYGRFAYDFGEVPLADVAEQIPVDADAMRLHSFNMQMNPNSSFARRQYVGAILLSAFGKAGADSGRAAYNRLKADLGPAAVSEELVNDVGYDLLRKSQVEPAIALFQLNVADHPASANAYDSMGEAYAVHGDTKQAIAAYSKSLELDPANQNAKNQLETLKAKPQKKGSGSKKT
jgi:tetratricopeptide (TPR) repeat protein